MTVDGQVIDLELERIARLPILNPNLESLGDLTIAYANQLFQLGHMHVFASLPVGSSFMAEIQVKIVEVEKQEDLKQTP